MYVARLSDNFNACFVKAGSDKFQSFVYFMNNNNGMDNFLYQQNIKRGDD